MRIPLALLICLTVTGQLPAEIRWNAAYTETYDSPADGVEIPFSVRTPPRVDGMETYPLLITLSGGLRITPDGKYPHIQARPLRNGNWGYRSISTWDAMQVIRFMKENYPVDPNRIYLFGSSAGGSGAMHLASCYPDEFAAVLPFIAAGNSYPLRNFLNLPVAFHHGDRDWVSAICNVRVQVQRMQELDCPATLTEYPGAGHGVPGSHEELVAWLFSQRRNPAPKKIRHDCETPSLGRSYWLRIDEFEDPHQRAFVEAEIAGQQAIVHPRNIVAFSLERDLIDGVRTVRIGETRLPAEDHYRLVDGQWQVSSKPASPGVRPYEAGGAANLYQGEPLLIVYGTRGEQTSLLKAAALQLAAFGGPSFAPMRRHRFPVVSDQEVSKDQQARSNLILIGRPEENQLTASLWPRLPLLVEDNVLRVADRAPLELQDQVLGLLHPSPDHPDRMIYILAPFTDAAGLDRFRRKPQFFLAGSDGFDRISQPDLVVRTLDDRVARQMQFGKNWQWLQPQGAETPLPAQFCNRDRLAMAAMKVMLSRSQADFALWWGPADRGMWGFDFNYLLNFDPASCTMADYRIQHRLSETTLGSVTGAELKDIWRRWGGNGELISYPSITPESLDEDALYRLHIPMDLYIKLGQRQQNLRQPAAGATFTPDELIPLILAPEP